MTPEATLLPPPPSLFDDDDDDNTSTSRTLEGLGASAVLGAMIAQRRSSRVHLDPERPERPELDHSAAHDGGGDEENRVVTKSGPVRRHSEGFLKVR
jgi:hypothetical protein